MRRSLRLLPLVLALLLLAGPTRAPAASGSLAQALDARLRGVPESHCGVAVVRRGAHPTVVYARGHNEALLPASTAKLLTSAAALDLLGPGYRFETSVTARGRLRDGVLHGDLVVHGTGDPNLSGRFYDDQPLALLGAFAERVTKAGIRRITGAVVLDDGPFDRAWVHPSWSVADRARWYGAPVGGLAFNDGCVDILVKGTKAGRPGDVTLLSTAGPWPVESKVVTAAASASPSVWATWNGPAPVLQVRGRIGAGQRYSFSYPVQNPVLFFGGAFLRVLAEKGIHVDGGTRLAVDAGDRQPGHLRIACHESPLGPTLDVMNRRSQNFYASLLFKAAGAALEGWGTWESGSRAVAEMLRRRGLDPLGETKIVDGSGLSVDNRTTAATLARLLVSFEGDLLRGPLLYHSLAVPGAEGTLSHRLVSEGLERRLHAKTGTLARSGVHALAGYLDGRDPHDPGYAFAILVYREAGARALIDDLVVEMARR